MCVGGLVDASVALLTGLDGDDAPLPGGLASGLPNPVPSRLPTPDSRPPGPRNPVPGPRNFGEMTHARLA